MMMSDASASSKPPPMAMPLTAAIRGLVRSKRKVMPPKPVAGRARVPPSACHFRSLPALKARGPSPVRMAIQRSGSFSKSSNIFDSS
jgi:hypothetical protein